MIEHFGKRIPTTLEELVRPEDTAVIVVDVQNDFCTKEGKLTCPEMVTKLRSLIEAARRAKVLVIYIEDTLLPRRMSDSAPWIRHYMIGMQTNDPRRVKESVLDGSWGQQVVDDIKPLPEDIIIKKFRSSSFLGTPLDLILRSNHIKTTVVTGVVTHGCVESTARDASNEYFVVVPEDCVWAGKPELHNACLTIMRNRYDVVKSEDILATWKRALL